MDTHYEARTAMFTLNNEHWTAHLNLWETPKVGKGAGIANALDDQGHGNANKYLFDVAYEDKNWRPDWAFATQFSNPLYVVQTPYGLLDTRPDVAKGP